MEKEGEGHLSGEEEEEMGWAQRLLGNLQQALWSHWVVSQLGAREEASFQVYATRLTNETLKVTAGAMTLLVLLAWPTDYLLFSSGSVALESFFYWRLLLLGVCAGVYFSLRWSPLLAAYSHLVGALGLTLALGGSGYLMARIGGLDDPLFYGIYTVPLTTVLLVVSLPFRTLVTFLIGITYLVVFFVTDRGHWDNPYLGSPFVWWVASSITAIVVGHLVYYLLRINFFQQRELDRRARELEELDQAKNEFFANINHELRTPLANILGALRNLERTGDAVAVEVAATASRNASHLLALLNDLLQLSRLDSGKSHLEKHPVDVAALVRQVVSEFNTSFEERISLPVALKDLSLLAEVDPRQMRTVLHNLLSNALKFTPPEKLPVEITLQQEGEHFVLAVRDRGIGIAPEQLESIFERFYQSDQGLHRRHGGVGIGLSLVKEIVELHQGQIEVESVLGQGTCLTLRLPCGEVEGATPVSLTWAKEEELFLTPRQTISTPPAPEPPLADSPLAAPPPLPSFSPNEEAGPLQEKEPRPLLLVCEDNNDLRAYLLELLRPHYSVIGAIHGRDGLQKCKEYRPQLILADIMMPFLSGIELLQEIRKDEELRHTPFLFLTAVTRRATRMEALEEGVSDYLQKPFSDAELLARIANLLRLYKFTRELESLVAEQTEELQLLVYNLVSVQEQERLRIAREFHDELGQILAGLRLEIDRIQLAAGNDSLSSSQLQEGLKQLTDLLEAIYVAKDEILENIRPRKLDSRGFSEAIRWLIEQFSRRTGLSCQIQLHLDEEGLSSTQQIALYRIVQEALTNVAQHARARNVEVELQEKKGELLLSIGDDGSGFSPEESDGDGFGLLGIRERSRLLHGSATIFSTPGEGTTVQVTIPLPSSPLPGDQRENDPCLSR